MGRNSPKTTTPADQRLGRAVRQRRISLGKSQDALGAALGVTYQQVQKYENATNRISADGLARIAKVLNTTVSALLGEMDGSNDAAGAGQNDALTGTREELSLLRAYREIEDATARSRLRALVLAMAKPSHGGSVREEQE